MEGRREKERMGMVGKQEKKKPEKGIPTESRRCVGKGGGERLRERPVAISHHGRRLMYAINHCGQHLINERYKNARQK